MIDLVEAISGRDSSRVLQHCRMSGMGAKFYGTADIADALREARLSLAAVDGAQSDTTAFLIAELDDRTQVAAVADHVDGWITRLWLLCERRSTALCAPHLSVPYDPDRDQRGAPPIIEPADFPGAVDAQVVGRAWELAIRAEPLASLPLTSIRAVVLRAIASRDRWFALARIDGASATGRAGCFAILQGGDDPHGQVILDRAGLAAALEQPWTPALRP